MKMIHQLDHPFLNHFFNNRLADPYYSYARLRWTGGLLRDATGVILVPRHHEVSIILRNPAFAFVGRQAFPAAASAVRSRLETSGFLDLLMFRSGPAHRWNRQNLSPLFSFERLSRLRAAITERVEEQLAVVDGSTFDFVQQMATDLSVHMLAELLGLDADSLRSRLARSRNMSALLTAMTLDEEGALLGVAEFEDLTVWLGKMLDNAGDSPADHPLGILKTIQEPAVRKALVADVAVILVTGHDASRAMLGNAMAALLADPDSRARMVTDIAGADPASLPRIADELIRIDTPGQIAFRHALEDVMIDGHQVRRGELIALLIGSANHDETVFDRPDRLDFSRSSGRPLSFGVGPHACIGTMIAKGLLTAVLRSFAPYLSRIELDGMPARAVQHGLMRGRDSLTLRIRSSVTARRIEPIDHPFPSSQAESLSCPT